MATTRGERRPTADDRLSELHAELSTAVNRLASSRAWKAWLDVAARFHAYSANNTILIWFQRPNATVVAGYRTWQRVGRQVAKGERGIQILAPVMKTIQADQDASQPESNGHNADSQPKCNRVMVGVRPTYVWDIQQTTGDPLPTMPRPTLLAGEAPDDLWHDLVDEVAARGYELRRGACRSPRAKGSTDFVLCTVTIRPDLSEAQATKTLAHELGHIALHDPNTTGEPLRACRGLVEVEAESVAYLVAKAHGLDTGGYSFPYITGWAAERNLGANPGHVVQQTATRVLDAAHDILNKLGHQCARLDVEPRVPGIFADRVRLDGPRSDRAYRLKAQAGLSAGIHRTRLRAPDPQPPVGISGPPGSGLSL